MSLDLMEEVRCFMCLQWGGAEDGGKEWVGGYNTKWQVGVYTRLMSQRNDVPYHCTAHVSKLMQKKALSLSFSLSFFSFTSFLLVVYASASAFASNQPPSVFISLHLVLPITRPAEWTNGNHLEECLFSHSACEADILIFLQHSGLGFVLNL